MMVSTLQIATPKQLAKSMCANHDKGQCIYGHPCRILNNKPCDYFLISVLPSADCRFYPEIKDIAELRMAYSKIDKRVFVEDVRTCRCGAALLKHKRMCARCRKMNRQNAWKNNKRKNRKKQNVDCPTEVWPNSFEKAQTPRPRYVSERGGFQPMP